MCYLTEYHTLYNKPTDNKCSNKFVVDAAYKIGVIRYISPITIAKAAKKTPNV